MGWGFFFCLRVYDKATKKKRWSFFDDTYRQPYVEYPMEIPKKFVDTSLYYGNITFGTCCDFNCPALYVDGQLKAFSFFYTEKTSCNYKLLKEKFDRTEFLYCKVRHNFPIVKSYWEFSLVHEQVVDQVYGIGKQKQLDVFRYGSETFDRNAVKNILKYTNNCDPDPIFYRNKAPHRQSYEFLWKKEDVIKRAKEAEWKEQLEKLKQETKAKMIEEESFYNFDVVRSIVKQKEQELKNEYIPNEEMKQIYNDAKSYYKIILCDLQKEMREKNMNEDEIEVVLQEKQKGFKKEVRENFPYFYTNEIQPYSK